MSDFFEQQLRHSLKRREAPAGFAERVSVRLPQHRSSGGRVWYALIAAALACLLVFSGVQHKREQKQNARETERQVVFALALAVQKIEHVNAHLQQQAPTVTISQNSQDNSGDKL